MDKGRFPYFECSPYETLWVYKKLCSCMLAEIPTQDGSHLINVESVPMCGEFSVCSCKIQKLSECCTYYLLKESFHHFSNEIRSRRMRVSKFFVDLVQLFILQFRSTIGQASKSLEYCTEPCSIFNIFAHEIPRSRGRSERSHRSHFCEGPRQTHDFSIFQSIIAQTLLVSYLKPFPNYYI